MVTDLKKVIDQVSREKGVEREVLIKALDRSQEEAGPKF